MKKKRWRRRRRRRRRRTCQGHLFPRSVAMVTGRWTKKKKKRSHESRERRRRVYYYHHFFQRIHNIQECHGNFLFECVCVCVFRLLSPHRLCLRWQRRFDVDFFFALLLILFCFSGSFLLVFLVGRRRVLFFLGSFFVLHSAHGAAVASIDVAKKKLEFHSVGGGSWGPMKRNKTR